PPRRVLESRGSRDHEERVADVIVSRVDVLATACCSRCALRRNAAPHGPGSDTTCSVFLRARKPPARPFSVTSTASGSERTSPTGPPAAGRLLMELRDRRIDVGVHSRAHVLHYDLRGAPERINPVALQPQDFVDEWLTRP